MDKCGGYYAKWNKPDGERQILRDLIYVWTLKKKGMGEVGGTSLRLHPPSTRRLGSIAGQGTRSHMLQLKILYAIIKTWHSLNK